VIDERRDDLRRLEPDELELVVRSALAAGYEVDYWCKRAPIVVGKVERDLFESLGIEDSIEAQQAVSQLVALASPALVRRLAALVDADFGDEPQIWIEPNGQRLPVRGTVLNLTTPRQRRAVQALTHMALPHATEALSGWTPPGMILIPAGPFPMGSSEYRDESPVHKVWLGAFWIDRYPVTNAQWTAFLEGGGWERRELWTNAGWEWKHGEEPEPEEWAEHEAKRKHPMRGICWYEALAYACWTGKGLLSEAQWEKAARGTEGLSYPWGDQFDGDRCNTAESEVRDTTPVGWHSPLGDSPYGVADMAGNVWEWCSSLHAPYPYHPAEGREPFEGFKVRVLRGGSFFDSELDARASYRNHNKPSVRGWGYGVRVGVAAPFSRLSGL
jgi:formylglycine-generating enzyme required for sulfatase activity